jgi:Na+/melibiose symporter-like transporter
VLASAVASVSLLVLFWVPVPTGSIRWLLVGLILPTFGVAMADVAIDALMVEKGQPLGLTGKLQSVQWAAMYAATILAGSLGGWLSQHKLQSWGFLICGLAMFPTVVLALFVREAPVIVIQSAWRAELRTLREMFRSRPFLAMCGFLLLWNLNPFSSTVLQLFMTDELHLSEQFYGHTVSLQAIASVAGCVAYGFYCRRIPFPWLIHGSVLCGILATIGYWLMIDQRSAVMISLAVGFVYITGNLIQMDLAARMCPANVAASVFASLMAICNLGLSLSHLLGGYLYELGASEWDRTTTFRVLVGIGAATTAACWAFVPWLRRQ